MVYTMCTPTVAMVSQDLTLVTMMQNTYTRWSCGFSYVIVMATFKRFVVLSCMHAPSNAQNYNTIVAETQNT